MFTGGKRPALTTTISGASSAFDHTGDDINPHIVLEDGGARCIIGSSTILPISKNAI